MLLYVIKELDLGIYIRYRLDGLLFDLRRLTCRAKTKTLKRLLLVALLFADDCALMAHNEHHSQVIIDKVFVAAKKFNLMIFLSKTVALIQPAPATLNEQPCITIDGTQLPNVESFKYLGSTIFNDGTLDREITTKIQKASQAFSRLRTKVLQHKNIRLSTKVKV